MPTESLLDTLRARLDHPADLARLMRLAGVPREHRASFRRQVTQLVRRGDLVQTRSGLFGLPERMHLAAGRLSLNASGFGLVDPDRPLDEVAGAIYVAGAHLNEAMHGDRVVVRVERVRHDGRAEGRIIRILERRSTRVVGRLESGQGGWHYLVPFDRRLLMDIEIPRGEEGAATPGEMVTVEITRWPTPARAPQGRVVEVLGAIDTPGVDTTIILRKYGIPDAHDEEAVEEARRLGAAVRPRDLEGRTDFRDVPIVTIDGETARDFDDAISIERVANGRFRLGVHIADVSHYVAEGSALDRDARERATSVYFPERAVHMFPEALATGLCSLRPHVDRLAQSCVMEIDRRGEVVRAEFHDAVIHSRARMTYTEVNAILTDRDPALREQYAELVPVFELMHELFEVLLARRRRLGSIDFDLPQPEVLLDTEGLVEDIIPAERNVAHRLIEEFMLVANQTVASWLDGRDAPALYRIHEAPDPLKVAQFEEFVSSLGYSLGAPIEGVEPRHFQRLIEHMKGDPAERPIAFLMLRTMQKARYEPSNLGHFGLAFTSYCHFTSPIRRYPDLVVHRALRALRHRTWSDEAIEERQDDLVELGRHTSDMERRAADAERELVQWKKVRFMADKLGEEYDGFITGVAAFGLFVELVEHFIEGMVHVSTMSDDFYRYVEHGHRLEGERTGKVYRLGDRVRVLVVRVDLDQRQVGLGLVEILEDVRTSGRGRAPRSTAAPRKAPSRPAGRTATKTDSRAAVRARARKASRVAARRSSRPGRRERGARKKGR
ncbi:MAG: ribonuclease R [Vicinamibacteraceae bacterium]|nr:ribonuclease R [Vicinamibacteraceae bacterium]